jgi:hypothetical protein
MEPWAFGEKGSPINSTETWGVRAIGEAQIPWSERIRHRRGVRLWKRMEIS